MSAGTTGHPYVRSLSRLASDVPAPPPEPHPAARPRQDAPAPRWVAALVLFGTLWGCLYGVKERAFTGHVTPFGEEPEIARHLALGHGYRSPFDRAATAPLT